MELGALVLKWNAGSMGGRSGWVIVLRTDLPAVVLVSVLTFGLLALILWGESVPLIPVVAFLVGCGLVFAYGSAAMFHSLRESGIHGSALKYAAVSVARGVVLPLVAIALLQYKRRHPRLIGPEPGRSVEAG